MKILKTAVWGWIFLALQSLAQSTYGPYTFTTFAGVAGSSGSTDGTASAAQFSSPHGEAVDSAGNIYVADYGNDAIRKGYPEHLPVIDTPPTIDTCSSPAILKEGSPNEIPALVSGQPTPQVQWFFNGTAIPGGTHATLTLPAVTRAREGTYWLVASNKLGQATSAPLTAVVSNVDPERFVGLQ